MTRSEAERRIALIDRMMAPAPDVMMAVLLVETLRVWGLPEGWERGTSKLWLEDLQAVPGDLLAPTLAELRRTRVFPPKPADVLACRPSQYWQRAADRRRLQSVLTRIRLDEADERRRELERRARAAGATP